jgi:hypothetical protein
LCSTYMPSSSMSFMLPVRLSKHWDRDRGRGKQISGCVPSCLRVSIVFILNLFGFHRSLTSKIAPPASTPTLELNAFHALSASSTDILPPTIYKNTISYGRPQPVSKHHGRLYTTMGCRGIATATFLHSVTVNTTMSLAERHCGGTAVTLLCSLMYRATC